MLNTLPWTPPERQKAPQKRLARERRRRIVEAVVAIMRSGEPTPFVFEGAVRHGIRASLCLQGWPWPLADAVSSDIVAMALARLGAKRPRWQQGQPEWTTQGFSPIARTRCRQCGRKLPCDESFGHRMFCSPRCRTNWHMRMFNLDQNARNAAAVRAGRAAR